MRRDQWFHDALDRVVRMDESDRDAGFSAPIDDPAMSLPAIDAAIDCAISISSRSAAEEAVAMAFQLAAALASDVAAKRGIL